MECDKLIPSPALKHKADTYMLLVTRLKVLTILYVLILTVVSICVIIQLIFGIDQW